MLLGFTFQHFMPPAFQDHKATRIPCQKRERTAQAHTAHTAQAHSVNQTVLPVRKIPVFIEKEYKKTGKSLYLLKKNIIL
jgi:hypothetical protein